MGVKFPEKNFKLEWPLILHHTINTKAINLILSAEGLEQFLHVALELCVQLVISVAHLPMERRYTLVLHTLVYVSVELETANQCVRTLDHCRVTFLLDVLVNADSVQDVEAEEIKGILR